MNRSDIIRELHQGTIFKITIRQGRLGCADAQDACDEFGYLLLSQRGDNYCIDDPNGENLVCVADSSYIESIIATAFPHAETGEDKEKHILFDPMDQEGMNRLMDEYGDSSTMYPGINENGEDVYISIFEDKIVTATTQSNGWIRKNIYYRDGSSEEMFER